MISNLQTVYVDPLSKIKIAPEQSYIELIWLYHPDSGVFRKVIRKAHDYAQEHQISKWLCNLEQAEFLELADQHWLVQEVFPSFNPQQQHDYAYLIRPMVLEVLTAYHIYDMIQMDERLNKKINVAVFTDIAQAQKWLFTSTSKSTSPI